MMEPAGTYKRTMALGIIMLMLGGALVGLFMARYSDFALNFDKLTFEEWMAEKREYFQSLDPFVPVDEDGNPLHDDSITRAGGGILEWKTTLTEVRGEPLSSPAIADLDGDGKMEIIIASAGDAVYALRSDGTYFWREPYTGDIIDYLGQTPQTSGLDFEPPNIFSSVTVGDIAAGPSPEIIIGVKDGALALTTEGNEAQVMWKKGNTNGYYFSTACITDLEGEWTGNKDDLEIVLASDDESRRGWLEAFRIDGGLIFREEVATGGEGGLIGCSVVASDLDGSFWDGRVPYEGEETWTELEIGNHDRGMRIWGFSGYTGGGEIDYSERTSGYTAGHQTYATAAVANITGDRALEIIVGSSEGYPRTWEGWGGSLYVYTPEGQRLWRFSTGSSRASVFSSPAVADIQMAKEDPEEKELIYEIVFGCDNGKVYMLDSKYHNVLWTFDTGGRVMSSPAIANFDSNDELEVVIGSDSGKVFCLDGDPTDGIDEGITYPGDGATQDVLWVYETGVPIGISSPVVGDIDLDGQEEVIIGDKEGNVYCISGGGRSIKGQKDWPEFHYDLNRTGFFNPQTTFGVDLMPYKYPDGHLEPLYKTVEPGHYVTYNITVMNTGKGVSTVQKDKIYLKVEGVPEGWKAFLDTPPDGGNPNPNYVKLAPQESVRVELKIWAPWEGDIGETARINVTGNSSLNPWATDTLTTVTILDLFVDFALEFNKEVDESPFSPHPGKKWDKITPGAEAYYTVIVTNKGNLNDTYDIILNRPPAGWNWSFVETGSHYASVDLDSPIFERWGAVYGTTLTVKVKCPETAFEGDTVTIVVTGTSRLSLGANVEILQKEDELLLEAGESLDLKLSIKDSVKYIDPGGVQYFSLEITNTGNRDKIDVLLADRGLLPGWKATYPTDPLEVYRGQTRTVQIMIRAPEDARANTKLVLNMLGWIEDQPNIMSTAPLTVVVNHIYRFNATVLKSYQAIDPGRSIGYKIQIKNTGNGDDMLTPKPYQLLLGWNMTFYYVGFVIKSGLPIDYDQILNITCEIRVPEKTPTGLYTIGINLTGQGGTQILYVKLYVNQTYNLTVSTLDGNHSIDNIEVAPNSELSYIVKVTNNGNGPEYATLTIKNLESGWVGWFAAVANTPDLTPNVKEYDFLSPIPISNLVPDVIYIPNQTASETKFTIIEIYLPQEQSAWVSVRLKSPAKELQSRELTITVDGSSKGGSKDDPDDNYVDFNIKILYSDLTYDGKIEILGGSKSSNTVGREGEPLTIKVNIKNIGDIVAEKVEVVLSVDGAKAGSVVIEKVGTEGVREVIFTWVARAGEHKIEIVIDPQNTIVELNENNNVMKTTVRVSSQNILSAATSDTRICASIFWIIIVIIIAVWLYIRKKRLSS